MKLKEKIMKNIGMKSSKPDTLILVLWLVIAPFSQNSSI